MTIHTQLVVSRMTKEQEAVLKKLIKLFPDVSITFRKGEPKEITIGSNDEDDGVGADRWKIRD